ncbi:MAG: DNA primase [Bacteroidetes bacterium]|nr:DNA primase [Bacteroidota bacterium]
MIPKETIDLIFDAARIEDVVGDFVSLKKRGVNFLGNCPFHNEKSPSFTVSPVKGIFKCFGCGKAGNAVNFIMEHEHYSYPEALKFLAGKYNIEIPEDPNYDREEEQQAINEKESLFLVSDFARKFFTENLLESTEGKAIALSYFKERGFRQDIIEKFQLGYSPESRSALLQAAIDKSYNPDYFVKAGLIGERENAPEGQSKHYDRFSGRVMFPIHNLSGRVIAFGGRILQSNNKKIAKYINSPETAIYSKSKVLYGISYAKRAIISEENCFLVEGYTDVVSFHQSGIENVVASSGTSLTVEQIKLIKRYTENITILFDGDDAGIKASLRGINLILEEGMNVKVVLFPDGEDPDSFAKSRNSDEVKKFISDNAVDFIVFKSNLLLKDVQNDPIKRAGLITEIIQTISLIPDAIIRSVYVKECSSILDVAEQTIVNELNKLRRKKFNNESGEQVIEENRKQSITDQEELQEEVETRGVYCEAQEKDLVRVMLNYGEMPMETEEKDEEGNPVSISVAQFIMASIEEDGMELEHEAAKKIYTIFNEAIKADGILPPPQVFINHPDQEITSIAIGMLTSPYELHNWEKHSIYVNTEKEKLERLLTGSLTAYKAKKIEQMEKEIRDALFKKPAEKEETELLIRFGEISKIKQLLNKPFGRIILK